MPCMGPFQKSLLSFTCMKKNYILIGIFLCMFSNIWSQTEPYLRCTVVNDADNSPIRATISSNTGVEFTLTNEEGTAVFRQNFLSDTLWTVDAVGFLPYTGPLDSIIRLAPCIDLNENTSPTGYSIISEVLRKVEKNYSRVNQFFYGFYNESVLEGMKLSAYSEGIVQSFKGPYRNNFGFDDCFKALENETSILLKGNSRNNFIENRTYPLSDKGYLLPKTLDPLSICSSPLISENLEHFEFEYVATLDESPEALYVVRFENKNSGLAGSIFIGKETHGIYKLHVDEETSITTLDAKINEIHSSYSVDYLNNQGQFFLSNIVYTQKLYDSESGDTISINSNYVTTRLPITIDSLPPRKTILARNKATEPYLDLHPNRHFAATQIIPRTKIVEDKVGNGEKINFDDGNLKEVIRNSQINENLIFLYVYAENDIPSRQMEENTFRDQQVVSYLNRNFTCSSFSIDEAEDNGLLYMADLEFLPSYIIMTPLGQIIQIFDGFIMPEGFMEILEAYEGFNVRKLFYAYDKRDGSENKKINSAYLDLFRQLRDMNHPNAIDFVDFFEDETKNWDTPEAKSVVYEYLYPSGKKKYNEVFHENIPYYESLYGKEEVAKKLYTAAYQKVLDRDLNDYKEFKKYLDEYAPAYTDSLYSYYLVDYFSTLKVNKPSYIAATLEYLERYHTNNWPLASRHLMTLGINTDELPVIYRGMEILKNYEGKVTEYEYLDVYSLFLYKSGQEVEALELVNKIKSLANKQGINYEVALRALSSKNANN